MDINERGLLDLIIVRIPLLSPVQRLELVKKFSNEKEISGLKQSDIERICGKSKVKQGSLFGEEENASWTMDRIRLTAEKDAVFMDRCGIGYVSFVDPEYPELLKEIYDPPPVLFYRGNRALLTKACVTVGIVGTRMPCSAALNWTHETASDLGRAGVSVVSGLALGIDAMAHRGNVDGGGKTIAVFGGSVDEVYPASNRSLARRILADGGVFVSEYPLGSKPAKWTFPARNRIISGLCPMTVVVEAGKKSGALITAAFALEQNRDTAAAVDENGEAFGEGCRKLIEDGAKKIYGAEDVLIELGISKK